MPLQQGIDAVPTTVCAYANHRVRRRKRLFALAQIQTESSNRVWGGCTLLKGVHPLQTRINKGLNENLGGGCGGMIVFVSILLFLSNQHPTSLDYPCAGCIRPQNRTWHLSTFPDAWGRLHLPHGNACHRYYSYSDTDRPEPSYADRGRNGWQGYREWYRTP